MRRRLRQLTVVDARLRGGFAPYWAALRRGPVDGEHAECGLHPAEPQPRRQVRGDHFVGRPEQDEVPAGFQPCGVSFANEASLDGLPLRLAPRRRAELGAGARSRLGSSGHLQDGGRRACGSPGACSTWTRGAARRMRLYEDDRRAWAALRWSRSDRPRGTHGRTSSPRIGPQKSTRQAGASLERWQCAYQHDRRADAVHWRIFFGFLARSGIESIKAQAS